MKVILLCLALLSCYQAAHAPSGSEILSLIQQDTNVDRVLSLLQGWRESTNGDINTLDDNYSVHEPELQGLVDSAEDALDDKLAQCAAIDDTVRAGLQQAQNIRDNIAAAQDTIASNNQKAEDAKDARCASNLLFVSELAGKEEAVGFLAFLRAAVASSEFADYVRSESGAFIQLKKALASKQENEILSLIAKHHMLSVLQVKQDDASDYTGDPNLDAELTASVRDSEEVGTDYIDNDRGALNVDGVSDDYDSVETNIAQLLAYIDELINNLTNDAEQLQAAETAAVQAFIEYVQQLKDQNYVLARFIEAAQANLADVEATNVNNQAAADACRAAVVPLEATLAAAQDAHDSYVADYQNKRATAVDLLALLDEAIQVYTEQVVNVASEAEKSRADDYLDNQVFDSSASFDARTNIPDAPAARGSAEVGGF